MSRPIVAIVGRPNVGKSTLFNKLIGQRLSIVEDTPGVTRDRIFGECEWKNRKFSLVDTGGIEPESKDIILSQMRTQAQIAIDSADCIIFVTDVRTGMVATDLNIAQMLQRSNVPVIVCVNKLRIRWATRRRIFMSFITSASAILFRCLPCTDTARATCWMPSSSICRRKRKRRTRANHQGRRHPANRTSANLPFVNRVSGENRCIVSNIAGTTRRGGYHH